MEYINIEWGTDLKLKIHVDPVLKDKEEGSESLEDTYVSISQCIDFYIEAFTKGKKD